MTIKRFFAILFAAFVASLTVSGTLYVSLLSADKVADPVVSQSEVYTFTAAPRETVDESNAVYEPIARLLSDKTRYKFVYHRPDNWLSYQEDMRKGRYHLIFDEPHFVSWRVRTMGHVPIVRLPDSLAYKILIKDDDKLTEASQLSGSNICSNPPPDLGTLMMLAQFDNPLRQPNVVVVPDAEHGANELLNGRCRASVMLSRDHRRLTKTVLKQNVRVLFKGQPLPNQAFSIDGGLPAEVRDKVREVLLSKEGAQVTLPLRERFADGGDLVPTDRDEYLAFSVLLKEFYGLEFSPLRASVADSR